MKPGLATTALHGIIAVVTLSGCSNGFGRDWSSGTGPGTVQRCEFRFSNASCEHLAVSPFNANVLLGDTIPVSSRSDDESPLATWTVQGDAVAFISGDTLASAVMAHTNRVTVKTVRLGLSTIVAKSSTREARTAFTVADSSIIVTLEAGPGPEIPVRTGASWPLTPRLRDVEGRYYTAQPTWSSSDTLIVDFVRSSNSALTYARARKAGTVLLIASFLALRDTLGLTVMP